jgi:CheY-like chemotaxis protein
MSASSLKILIVDDAQDNRDLFYRFLVKIGIDAGGISTAKDGLEAIELAQQQKPDFILMDIQMPRMDGYEALKILKKNKYPGKVIALTASAIQGDKEQFLAYGFDNYLQKPINKKSLAQALQR